VVQFRCLDGFVASISKERILHTGPGQSVAYIAKDHSLKIHCFSGKAKATYASPYSFFWPSLLPVEATTTNWRPLTE